VGRGGNQGWGREKKRKVFSPQKKKLALLSRLAYCTFREKGKENSLEGGDRSPGETVTEGKQHGGESVVLS